MEFNENEIVRTPHFPVRAAVDEGRNTESVAAAGMETGLTVVDTTDIEALKKKYGPGEIYQIDVTVDEDDENTGRILRFIFKRPSTASFNRYLKTASKNMAVSTTNFVMDNIVDEHSQALKKESEQYPGLALNIGQKLLTSIGMGDNINFRKL